MSVFKRYKGKRINAKDKDWNKGTWYVWKRVNGRIIHKSLPDARTKEQAELAERRLIERVFNRRFGVTDSESTFDAFANGAYRRYVQQNNVNLTAKDLYIRLLCNYFRKRLLSEITPQDCRDCQWHLQHIKGERRDRLSKSSVNRAMSTLSKIFSLACEEAILDRNPMQYVRPLKEPAARSRLLTGEEKERLWNELEKDELMKRLVILAVNLPLRRGQIIALHANVIDFAKDLVYVIASKGRDPRAVPLNATASVTLKAMVADSQLPFPIKDFRRRWHRALFAAGINRPGESREQNFHFHDLRKEFASELIRKNVNPNLVQKLFAHSSLAITNIYMHSEMDELKAAVNTLDATDLQPTDKTEGLPN